MLLRILLCQSMRRDRGWRLDDGKSKAQLPAGLLLGTQVAVHYVSRDWGLCLAMQGRCDQRRTCLLTHPCALWTAGDDIGMVLSPQCFHNLNLHEDIFNHSNIHFWEYMQPGYDALGFISCTGAVFREGSWVALQPHRVPQSRLGARQCTRHLEGAALPGHAASPGCA